MPTGLQYDEWVASFRSHRAPTLAEKNLLWSYFLNLRRSLKNRSVPWEDQYVELLHPDSGLSDFVSGVPSAATAKKVPAASAASAAS
jgi:hypothetical protein